MRERCDNPKAHNYRFYGGKGVTYAEEWRDWATFRDWAISQGYADNLELDRIDADKPYEPSNCRWLLKRENIKRSRLALGYSTDALLQAEAATLGISPEALIVRLIEERYARVPALSGKGGDDA